MGATQANRHIPHQRLTPIAAKPLRDHVLSVLGELSARQLFASKQRTSAASLAASSVTSNPAAQNSINNSDTAPGLPCHEALGRRRRAVLQARQSVRFLREPRGRGLRTSSPNFKHPPEWTTAPAGVGALASPEARGVLDNDGADSDQRDFGEFSLHLKGSVGLYREDCRARNWKEDVGHFRPQIAKMTLKRMKPLALEEYKRKRRISKRPPGASAEPAEEGRKLFRRAEHDATRLHYDFRLEMEGVLKYGRCPKGARLNPLTSDWQCTSRIIRFRILILKGTSPRTIMRRTGEA